MAKIRRVIRKTKQPTEAAFDEQFWPVMLALFVLAAAVVATAIPTKDDTQVAKQAL